MLQAVCIYVYVYKVDTFSRMNSCCVKGGRENWKKKSG